MGTLKIVFGRDWVYGRNWVGECGCLRSSCWGCLCAERIVLGRVGVGEKAGRRIGGRSGGVCVI